MGLFKKKSDPITDRARELNAKISALEAKIKRLDQEMHSDGGSRLKSPVEPREIAPPASTPAIKPSSNEPIFEKVDQNNLKAPSAPASTAGHYNELGVRKYDLMSLIDRIRKQFQAPPAANPKLVNYLASGSIQGLRPLRYEKRVARNRFLLLAGLLLLAFLGILSYALEHHR